MGIIALPRVRARPRVLDTRNRRHMPVNSKSNNKRIIHRHRNIMNASLHSIFRTEDSILLFIYINTASHLQIEHVLSWHYFLFSVFFLFFYFLFEFISIAKERKILLLKIPLIWIFQCTHAIEYICMIYTHKATISIWLMEYSLFRIEMNHLKIFAHTHIKLWMQFIWKHIICMDVCFFWGKCI